MTTAGTQGKMVLPTLVFTRFISSTPSVLTGLLLLDISLSFDSPVGVTGQIRTASSIVALVAALAVGALSVRMQPKTLLLLGLGSILVSSIGCSMCNSFLMLFLLYPLTGLGVSLVTPMGSTLVAEYFTGDKRASAVGWLLAGGSLSWVIGSAVITNLAKIGGWRLAYSGFVVTSLVLGTIAAKIFLPEPEGSVKDNIGIAEGFKAVYRNRSALGCLFSTIFRVASFQALALYSASFYRQVHLFSTGTTTVIVTLCSLCYTFGSIMAGRIVERFNRKNVTWVTLLLGSVLVPVFILVTNIWISLAAYFLTTLFLGIGSASGTTIFLDQEPEYRGTMMSFVSAFSSLGVAVGASVGGIALLSWGYVAVGGALGTLGFLGALTVLFMVKDGAENITINTDLE